MKKKITITKIICTKNEGIYVVLSHRCNKNNKNRFSKNLQILDVYSYK